MWYAFLPHSHLLFSLSGRINLIGHTGYIYNIVAVSPDGSLCASGSYTHLYFIIINIGKDGTAMLWDLNEGKHLYSLDSGDMINAMRFSPNRYWLCAATNACIKIWVPPPILSFVQWVIQKMNNIPFCLAGLGEQEQRWHQEQGTRYLALTDWIYSGSSLRVSGMERWWWHPLLGLHRHHPRLGSAGMKCVLRQPQKNKTSLRPNCFYEWIPLKQSCSWEKGNIHTLVHIRLHCSHNNHSQDWPSACCLLQAR